MSSDELISLNANTVYDDQSSQYVMYIDDGGSQLITVRCNSLDELQTGLAQLSDDIKGEMKAWDENVRRNAVVPPHASPPQQPVNVQLLPPVAPQPVAPQLSGAACPNNVFSDVWPDDPNVLWLALYGWRGGCRTRAGCDGPSALRVIGSCLDARFGLHSADQSVDLDGIPYALGQQQSAWLNDVRSKVGQLQQSGLSFVVCAHLAGSQLWELHWSNDLDADAVRSELKTFVECGAIHEC